MGATLETMTVEATTAKEAAVKIIGSGFGSDPYSGWFDTCHEFVDKTYKLKENEFTDWVMDNGEKRVLYVIKMTTTTYLGSAWCAC